MNRFERSIRRERIIKFFSVMGILASLILVITFVDHLLLSFVLALVLNYLLRPVVTRLERAGVRRNISIITTFALLGLIISLGFYLVLPSLTGQIQSLKNEFPGLVSGTGQLAKETQQRIDLLLGGNYELNLGKNVERQLFSLTSGFFEGLPQLITQLLATLVLAPFFAFFMLLDGRKMVRSLINLFPNNLFELALNLQHQINEQMGGFIRARIFEAGIVGLVVWIGLVFISFPYAFLLAVVAGITNLIPYVGPIIGAVPALLIALVNASSIYVILAVILVYFIAQLIDMVFIIPFVVAKIVDLHPVTVIVAITLGAHLMGILGMIISIPVTSALKVTITAIYRHLVDFRA